MSKIAKKNRNNNNTGKISSGITSGKMMPYIDSPFSILEPKFFPERYDENGIRKAIKDKETLSTTI